MLDLFVANHIDKVANDLFTSGTFWFAIISSIFIILLGFFLSKIKYIKENFNTFKHSLNTVVILHAMPALILFVYMSDLNKKDLSDLSIVLVFGVVYAIFQSAEEIGFGANELIENGLFKKYKIDYLFALHGMNNEVIGREYKEGTICFYKGTDAITSSVKIFNIKFIGKGGHGSLPENCVDPIPAAVECINSLYYIKTRFISGLSKTVFSICNINSGSALAANIIPDYCVIKGTFRTFDYQNQKIYEDKIKQFVELTSKKYDLNFEINFMGTEATINDKNLNSKTFDMWQNFCNNDYIGYTDQVVIGEDFSLYGKHTKICLSFISTGNNYSPHSSKYDFKDEALVYGVIYYANIILNFLGK